jgi:hypothetical protein
MVARGAYLSLILLTFGAPAFGQGLIGATSGGDESARVVERPLANDRLSERERRYVRDLQRDLGKVRSSRRVAHVFEPGGASIAMARYDGPNAMPVGEVESGQQIFAVPSNDGTWHYTVGSPHGPAYDRGQYGPIRSGSYVTQPMGGGAQTPSSTQPPEGTAEARGVHTELADGTTIERLRFETPELAADYVMNNGDFDKPAYVEVRGNQVIVIEGRAVEDPATLDRMINSAFGPGLPVPEGGPRATGLFLEDGSMLISSDEEHEGFDRAFRQAQDKTREKIDQGEPGFEDRGDELDFRLQSGANGVVSEDGDRKTVVFAQNDEQRRLLDQHRQRLDERRGGQEAQRNDDVLGGRKATAGAADTLKNLFGN